MNRDSIASDDMVPMQDTLPAQTSALLQSSTVSAAVLRQQAKHIAPGRLFIGGQWRPAQNGATRAIIDPSTGEVITRVAEGSDADVQMAVKAARAAFVSGPWSSMSVYERGRVLLRIGDLMERRADELALRETIDVGRPISFTRSFDVPQTANQFIYYGGLATRLEGAARGPGGDDHALIYTRREPLGVVGAITPFNFPLALAVNKIAPALAAGNVIVHKPAEETPLSSLLLAEIMAQAGLPNGVYNLVTGSGNVVGDSIVRHPEINKLAFTGSTQAGVQCQINAAPSLKHVTLELGGKNANLVFADADLDAAVETTFLASYFNTGQFCMGCSRLFVEQAVHDTFVEKLLDRIAHAQVGDPCDPATEIGPLSTQAQYDKVKYYISVGLDEGATLRAGGKPLTVAATGKRGFFFEPSVFTHVRPDMRIAREEIFGPVLSILTFDTVEEAIRLANDSPYGLAAGVQTQDIQKAHYVAARLEAGMVWINTWGKFTPDSPFGGYKASGYGRELGPEGIEEYLQYKCVYVDLA